MRKLVTIAATALTIGLVGFSAPAMADEFRLSPSGQHPQGQYQGNGNGQGYGQPGYDRMVMVSPAMEITTTDGGMNAEATVAGKPA